MTHIQADVLWQRGKAGAQAVVDFVAVKKEMVLYHADGLR